MGLLNMDEFDKYGTQQMPLLKNLMQMANLNICKAYQKNFRNLPRIASLFIIFSYPEAGMKDFLCRTRMIKNGIVALQFPFLFFGEPIADAGEQFSFQLGIDLGSNGL